MSFVALLLGAAVGPALARPAPGPTEEIDPLAGLDAATIALLAGDQRAALDAMVSPAWGGDGESVSRFLASHYDEATGTFAFTGPTAANDTALAQAVMDQAEMLESLLAGVDADMQALARAVFLGAPLPDGWEEATAGEPAGDAVALESPPSREALEAAPLPPAASAAGPDAAGSETKHFFIGSCPRCDQYLFAGAPITATFDLADLDPAKITEGALDVSAYDVDWGSTGCSAGPERDAVLLNGNFVGYLTGADSSWSASSYSLNPAWFVAGVNTIDVIIDATGTGCWAVQVDWFDVTVNRFTGPVRITEHKTDKNAYNLAETIQVRTTLLTEEEGPYSARVEWNLVQPDGNIVRTTSASVSLAKDVPKEVLTSFAIPNPAKEGTWTVVAIAYDKDGGKSDERAKEIAVGTDLAVTKDDLKLKVLDTNRESGVARVEATIAWDVNTKIADPQAYAMEIAVVSGGTRAPVEKIDRSDTSGKKTLTRTLDVKPGSKLEVVLDTGNAIKESKEDNNKAEKSLCNPKVKEAEPKVKGKYLSGVEFKNEWKAKVEAVEEGCPEIAKVVYDFDGTKVESTDKANDWKLEFDMGKIKAGFNRPMKVYAVDAEGNQGDPWETKLWMRALPTFVVWGWKGGGANAGVTLEISIQGDAATFKFGFNKTFLRKEATISDKVPIVGGKWGGKVDFTVEAEVTTKGDTFKITGGISGSFKAGNKAGVSFKGTLSGTFKNPPGDEGWRLSKLTVSGSGTFTSPPIYIPQLTVPKVFETTVVFSIGLGVKFGFSESGTWEIFGVKMDQFEFSVTVGLTVTMKLSLDKLVSFSASGGGTVTPYASFPPPDLLSRVDVSLTFSVKGSFLGWEKTFFEYKWTNSYLFGLAPDPTFTLPERAWIGDGYARFAASGADGALVEGMYPNANPETASNSLGQMMSVFTHDDASRSRPQSFDAQFTFFDGESWSAPAAISSTAHPDFDPAVALSDAGAAAAVWMRFEDETLAESVVLPEVAHLVDLWFSTWTEATGWSEPAPLTDNGVVDLKQTVVADGAGGFLVAYVSDATSRVLTPSQLTVVEDQPVLLPTRDLHVAGITSGGVATPSATLATGVAMVGMPRVVPLGAGALLYVYAEDADGDARTASDVTLRAVPATLAGPAGVPIEVATGYVKEPVVALDGGSPVVAWVDLADGAERQRILARDLALAPAPVGAVPGVTLGAEAVLAPEADLFPIYADLSLAIDPVTHERIVTWTGSSADGKGQQVFSAIVPATGVPSSGPSGAAENAPGFAAVALTAPDAVASRPGVAFHRDGEGARVVRAVTLDFDAAGVAELASASRTLGPDAAAVSLATHVANPAAGSTVNVTVRVENVGDEDLVALGVAVADNGAEIARGAIPLLERGAVAEYATTWTVPDDGVAHALVATLDPDGLVDETSEENNVASRTTVFPDLAVSSLAQTDAGGAFRVEATLANVGGRAAPAGVATLSLDEGGQILAVDYPALAAGASATLDVTPALASLPAAGGFVTLRARAPDDFDAANDARSAFALAAPDLAVSSADVRVPSAFAGPAVAVEVTVRNVGVVASPPSALRVLDEDEAATELARVPLPAIAAGASATVTATFPAGAGERTIFVRAGEDGAIDANALDNVAGKRVTLAGRADPDASIASLAFEPGGVRVTVFNRGDAEAPFVPFTLFNGPPATAPKYGPKYVTEVPTVVGRGAVGNVPPGGSASTLIPTARLSLAQIPASGTLSVWLDPSGVVDDAARGNNQGATPAFSARSTTHPDPLARYALTAASFAFGVKPGFSYGGASLALDRSPSTVPDTIVDTTATTWSASGLTAGSWWLHARGLVAGTWTSTVHVPLGVALTDSTPPVTDIVIAGPWIAANGTTFLADTVPISLAARDPPGVSGAVTGVALTEYAVDGAWRPYAGPFRLTAAGAHLVEWRSRDAAGNVEATRARHVTVETDTHAPETSVAGALVEDGALWARPGAPLTLDAKDPQRYVSRFPSGVARSELRIDGGAWTTYTGSFALSGADGARAVDAKSVDVAGNAEAAKSFVVTLDGTAPVVAIVSHADGDVVAGRFLLELDAVDAGVGVARAELWHEGKRIATLEGGNGAFVFEMDPTFWTFGNNHLEARVFDALGNGATAPLTLYAVSRNVPIWKDPMEALDRWLPGALRGLVPVGGG